MHSNQTGDPETAIAPDAADQVTRLPSTAQGATATGASAVGTAALGSVAFGAIAIGAIAIGALAIGRLAIGGSPPRRRASTGFATAARDRRDRVEEKGLAADRVRTTLLPDPGRVAGMAREEPCGRQRKKVGFHKAASGRKGITYREALDEALCFGWIDGHPALDANSGRSASRRARRAASGATSTSGGSRS